MSAEIDARRFLESALVTESAAFDNSDFVEWFESRKPANQCTIRLIRFDEMDQWSFEPNRRNFAHDSRRFFSIEGLRVDSQFQPSPFGDQPIILQPEVGILGMLAKTFDGILHFLMQAKAEPGNPKVLQLAPTVQATRSNYTRVHGGRVPPYLDYFVNARSSRRLVDQLQPEQGSHALSKRNRNMIIEVNQQVPVGADFRWLTLGEIKRLMARDHFVNADARSVVACVPLRASERKILVGRRATACDHYGEAMLESLRDSSPARALLSGTLAWMQDFRPQSTLKADLIPLGDLRDWTISESAMVHSTRSHFSIVAIEAEAANREVRRWTQPMLKSPGRGFSGFLIRCRGGGAEFLVQATMEPGEIDAVRLAPTVSYACGDPNFLSDPPPFLEHFLEAPLNRVRYSAKQSEEGGRFLHVTRRTMIVELPESTRIDVPKHFAWMPLSQLLDLIRLGHVTSEARSLVACLSWH